MSNLSYRARAVPKVLFGPDRGTPLRVVDMTDDPDNSTTFLQEVSCSWVLVQSIPSQDICATSPGSSSLNNTHFQTPLELVQTPYN